jgi:phage I-like protein
MRNVSERDSSAMGWISNLKAITNLGDMSGLYGVIKWTSEGIRLAKERIYRFLSPVFELDADGKVLSLLNVGLTNRPALKMMPIINSEGDSEKQISITNEEINMSKEDIKQMILETIEEVNQSKLSSDIATEEIKEEVVEETVEEKIEEPETVEETVEETAEEIKEEVVEETVEEEVIKKESLNSMPVTVGQSIDNSQIWKKLHGQEFLDYVNKHKNELM